MQGHTVGLDIVYLQQNRLEQHTIAFTSVHVLRRWVRVAGNGDGLLQHQGADYASIFATNKIVLDKLATVLIRSGCQNYLIDSTPTDGREVSSPLRVCR